MWFENPGCLYGHIWEQWGRACRVSLYRANELGNEWVEIYFKIRLSSKAYDYLLEKMLSKRRPKSMNRMQNGKRRRYLLNVFVLVIYYVTRITNI